MRIELLGTSFTIRSDQDDEYLREVVALYARKVAEIQRTVATNDRLKVAILAGVLITDEFLKLRGSARGDDLEARRIADVLIGELNDVLDDRNGSDAQTGSEI
jgi:cell division protein ZapA (FtsZ GTPase activity inhibitor)